MTFVVSEDSSSVFDRYGSCTLRATRFAWDFAFCWELDALDGIPSLTHTLPWQRGE